MAAMGLTSKLAKRTRTQNPERPLTVLAVTSCHTTTVDTPPSVHRLFGGADAVPVRVDGRGRRVSDEEALHRAAGCVACLTSAQRVAVCLSHCFAEQPSCRPGPKLPRPGRPTLRKRSHNKEARVRRPPVPITQRQRQAPRGPWVGVPETPWCRESRSCGRAACSRENCALCVAEICTVISSAVRVGRGAGWTPPHRSAFHCRLLLARDSMAPKLKTEN